MRASMTRRVVRSTRRPTAEALGNGRHVRNVAPSICAPRLRPTRLARRPQGRQQFAAQGAARQDVQARIERLRREVFLHVVRIRASEASSNLLGRAASAQVCPDILPEPGIQEFAWAPGLTRPGRRQVLRCAGPIGSVLPRVAGQLTAHRAWGAPQHRRHRPQRIALGQSQAQGFTFLDTHVRVALLWHGNTVADQGHKCCTWS